MKIAQSSASVSSGDPRRRRVSPSMSEAEASRQPTPHPAAGSQAIPLGIRRRPTSRVPGTPLYEEVDDVMLPQSIPSWEEASDPGEAAPSAGEEAALSSVGSEDSSLDGYTSAAGDVGTLAQPKEEVIDLTTLAASPAPYTQVFRSNRREIARLCMLLVLCEHTRLIITSRSAGRLSGFIRYISSPIDDIYADLMQGVKDPSMFERLWLDASALSDLVRVRVRVFGIRESGIGNRKAGRGN